METVNKGSKELSQLNVFQFKANEDFTDLYYKLIDTENVIVDVGASNLGQFWTQMSDFAGVESLFDYFVIPTVPNDKEQTDTYKTILFLRQNGIEDDKIKVIFNKVENTVSSDFSVLLNVDFDFDTDMAIKKSELFKELGFLRKTISEIYNPDLDHYRELLRAETDPQAKLALVKSDLANRMASSVKDRLDYIFSTITGKELPKEEPPKAEKKTPPKSVAKATPKKKAAPAAATDKSPVPEESAVSEDDEEL
ncbi:MAG: hypothetical protein OIF32_02355 [Campylobacterales bacterium]|nr:hypothetical protein [Campylobacterales bacterium]